MKSIRNFLLTLALSASLLAVPAFAEEGDYISVAVNGKMLFLEQAPVMKDGSVLVPLRGIFEALGAKVKWESATRTVHSFTVDPDTPNPDPNIKNIAIDLPLDSKTAYVNGQVMELKTPATMINGNTMVPLRFISEAMGAKVKWYGEEKMVRAAQEGFEATLDMPERTVESISTWNIAEGLPRIMVGGQAGLVKILDKECLKEAYIRTLDNYTNAEVTTSKRDMVYQALELNPGALNHLCSRLINEYSRQRKYQTQIIALLGLVTSADEGHISLATSQLVRSFLLNKLYSSDAKLNADANSVLKRQALLALAFCRSTSYVTVDKVTTFFEKTDNNYILSPISLFYRLHAKQIKAMPEYEQIYSRVSAVNSMYTPNCVESLKK